MAAPVKQNPACRTLFVRNLPFDTTNADLEELFGEVGPVKRCFVIKNKDDDDAKQCKGYGYVTYSMIEDATKALKIVKSLNGRKLFVSYSDKRSKREHQKGKTDDDETETSKANSKDKSHDKSSPKNDSAHKKAGNRTKIPVADLELTNLPGGTTEKLLTKYLSKVRNIESVVFPVKGEEGLAARVLFEHKAGATNARKILDTRKIMGKPVTVTLKEVSRRDRPAKPDSTSPSAERGVKTSLVIRNLAFACNEDKLRKIFKQFGTVSRVFIPKQENGRKKGCAFVDLSTRDEASRALEQMNGQQVLGRRVAVDWAMGKKEYLAQGSKELTTSLEKKKKPIKPDAAVDEDEEESADDSEDGGEDASGSDRSEDEDGEEMEDEDSEEEESDEDEELEEETVKRKKEEESEDSEDDDEEEDEMSDSDDEEMDAETKKAKKPRKRDEGPGDVTEGRTLFIRNLSYDTEEEDLEELMEEFGQLEYCRVVMDKNTDRSKGMAFVKFEKKTDAEKCLEKANDESKEGGLTLDKRKLSVVLAVEKKKAKELAKPKQNEKEDKRNLHLVREGMVRPGTQSAQGVSQSDLEKRMKCERLKRAKLKNPYIFVSATRLSVHNIPTKIDDTKLRRIFTTAVGDKKAKIVECRIMRDLERVNSAGVGRSRGYGFVAFAQHEHALKALRNVNNNAKIFDADKRPIVEFSLENRRALEAKQRRLERSKSEQDTKSNPLQVAPTPTDEEGNKKKIPKGLPSHWGPKIRHNRPKPQKIPNKPKGKVSRKQVESKQQKNDQMQHEKKREEQPKPKKKKNRGKKRKQETDAFDKLVSSYKSKIQGGVKKAKWFD